ncbi:hypothetical protein RQN30_00815 [Arcanobacterium hippocoleae]
MKGKFAAGKTAFKTFGKKNFGSGKQANTFGSKHGGKSFGSVKKAGKLNKRWS